MILFDEPRLSPLELWHGLARGATLFELRDNSTEYFPALREFLIRLHHGQAATLSEPDTLRLQQARSFQRLIVCGGEASHPTLAAALVDLPFATEIVDTGPYAGKRGANRIFAQQHWQRGVALDLGQTQLKIMSTAGHDRCLPRDPSHLPFGPHTLEEAEGRQRVREFLRQGLMEAQHQLGAEPDGVVLALPVAVDRKGHADSSTYPGLYGPLEPLFAELFPMPWLVLNDAILAAVGFPPRASEKTLVITLGFGVGGALWS